MRMGTRDSAAVLLVWHHALAFRVLGGAQRLASSKTSPLAAAGGISLGRTSTLSRNRHSPASIACLGSLPRILCDKQLQRAAADASLSPLRVRLYPALDRCTTSSRRYQQDDGRYRPSPRAPMADARFAGAAACRAACRLGNGRDRDAASELWQRSRARHGCGDGALRSGDLLSDCRGDSAGRTGYRLL